MKKLFLMFGVVVLSVGFIYCADENAKRDANYFPTQIGVDNKTGEIRRIKTRNDGRLLVSEYDTGISWEIHQSTTNSATSTVTFPGSITWFTIYPVGGGATFQGATGNTTQKLDTGVSFTSPKYDITVSSPSYIKLTGLSTAGTYYVSVYGVR